jgi:hypothetical protein
MMRPRGKPPMPSAVSSAREPVGMTSTCATSWPPRRMIAPAPNCFWMTRIASSMALPRALDVFSVSWR